MRSLFCSLQLSLVANSLKLAFYAVCLDLAVKKCGMGATLDYTALGHIARLFVVLVKYFPEKPLLLARLLCVTEAVISATHQASVCLYPVHLLIVLVIPL